MKLVACLLGLQAIDGRRPEDTEEAEESYTDARQREIKVVPYGPAMTERCQAILAQIK